MKKMMRLNWKYVIAAGIVVMGVVIAVIALRARSGRNDERAAEVIEEFYRLVGSGSFDKAEECCTGDAMEAYLSSYKALYDDLYDKDVAAGVIAGNCLSGLQVKVSEVASEKGIRTVFCTIEDEFGNVKQKVAVLKEIEGKWKIVELKDRI